MNSLVCPGSYRRGLCMVIALLLLAVLPAAGLPVPWEGNNPSDGPTISADGRFVAFESSATNLVAGDTNGAWDIFVRDRQTGTTYLVSKSSSGVQGDGLSNYPSISADGRFVAFQSVATSLVAGDTNAKTDIFVRDRQTGTTTLVSKDSAGVQGDDNSKHPMISADGRYVVFDSYATNLVTGDTNGFSDIFVRDRQTGTTTLISKSSAGVVGDSDSIYPSFSSDDRYVAFESYATNLVAGDTNGMYDIFVRDRLTGTTTLVSKSSAGGQGDDYSEYPRLSADGRYVAFSSDATNMVPGDTNAKTDVFVRDRQTGTTWLLSKDSAGVPGDSTSSSPSISSDGRFVVFYSDSANLVSGDNNAKTDIFVRDRQTGTTTLLSKSPAGVVGNDFSGNPAISADGRYVAFDSYATNLVSNDINGVSDVFVRDRNTGTTTLSSRF
jgi:Tol biopolymer transport system component